MIKKSIIFFVILFSLWSVYLSRQTNFSYTEHLWQRNLSKIEHFQFDKTLHKDRIIIGTSLSKKIHTDSIHDIYNLALSGQSILDGLELLKYSKVLPKEVLIETNLLLLKKDKDFLNLVKSPTSYFLKKHFLALRTDKHPLALVGNEYLIPSLTNVVDNEETQEVVPKDSFFQQIIALRTKRSNRPVAPSLMKKRINALKDYITYLQKNNVKVIFFEMPINPNLINLYRPTITRKEIKKAFPDIQYIDYPDDVNSYKTTDGVHLTNQESIRYSKYFHQMLERDDSSKESK